MSKKKRIPIPKNIAAEVLFLSDRTCCVCNEPGKKVQIHHIDENPSNNSFENLSVLCLEHHNDTMIQGGFGRKLDANQITLFRDNWLKRVSDRKAKADELASLKTITGHTESNIVVLEDETELVINDDPQLLNEYLSKILFVHKNLRSISQAKWDTGVTPTMNEGNSDMIDFYRGVLIELASFFPAGHFENQSPHKYFSDLIASRFTWHWLMNEPEGHDTGGRMASVISSGIVMMELQKMVMEMVKALLQVYRHSLKLDFGGWNEKWMNVFCK